MRKIAYVLPALLFSFALFAQPVKKERFTGLHFDFHASMYDSGIGKSMTEDMLDSMMRIIKPDFIQVDCKGHSGVTSYPSKYGSHAPAIEKDILQLWRTVTRKHNVALYVHYSGIWDNRALELHPEWGRTNEDGKIDKQATSFYSPYSDSIQIPQLIELARDYEIDGAWVDGDTWMVKPDYSEKSKAAFTASTGIREIPVKTSDPHYFEWMEFTRKQFRDYVTRYSNAVHKVAPHFNITSNWAYSSYMPEPVSIPIDYLSGDFGFANTFYEGCFEARCLAGQGKPWDLMAWAFASRGQSKYTKSITQLKQEAAAVLSQGGGFQSYWQQNRDGTPEVYQFQKMAEIIRFANERKAYTFQGKAVPQIGLLYSGYSRQRFPNATVYASQNQEGIKGALNLLLDSKYSVEVLMDHQLPKDLNIYPLLVMPEWENPDPAIRRKLIDYVKNGGNLIVIGAGATAQFFEELGVTPVRPLQKSMQVFAGLGENVLRLGTDFQPVAVKDSVLSIGKMLSADDYRFATGEPVSTIRKYGKGNIAGVYVNIASHSLKNQNPLALQLVQQLIKGTIGVLNYEITAEGSLHQAVATVHGNNYVHLINSGGPHYNQQVLGYDELVPVRNVSIKINTAQQPKSVLLQPGNRKLKYRFQKNILTVSIPEVQVYEILELKN